MADAFNAPARIFCAILHKNSLMDAGLPASFSYDLNDGKTMRENLCGRCLKNLLSPLDRRQKPC